MTSSEFADLLPSTRRALLPRIATAPTAGLAAETPGEWWERTPGTTRPALADVLGEKPGLHPVGRLHHYSNPGYTLLGSLIEAVRGEPWADVVRREVCRPLGMDRTSAQ